MPPARRRAKVIPIHAPKPAPIHPFDRLYGTDTGGLIPASALLTGHPNDAHLTAYYAVAPSILDTLIELWLSTRPRFPINRYTFLDIGAGKGRALLSASLHPFLQVVGVELNPTLAHVARTNIRIFESAEPSDSPSSDSFKPGRLSPITLLEGDALAIPLPSTPTLAFLFHPFEAPVLRRFIARIEQHFAPHDGETPPCFDLIYVNAEHTDVLEQRPAFTRLFGGQIPMSSADHLADLAEIAEQKEYGSTGDEFCTIYRYNRRLQ